MAMKKQYASTTSLFSLTDSHNERKTTMGLKNVLICLGLKYVPEKRDRDELQKNTPSKEGVHQVLLILDISYISFLQGKIARRL